MSDKELAKVETNSELPAYLQGVDAGNQQDNFDASDVVLPQIKLLQGMSAQCTDFEKASPGMFWHTGMDIALGDNVKFVVISRKKKYLLQAPIEDGQGILARADDARTWDRQGSWEVKIDKKTKATWTIDDLDVEASGLTNWGTSDPEDNDSPPAATLFYEYLVLMPEHLDLGPAIISMARSQIKQAKKGLNTKIDFHRNAGRPMQALVFDGKTMSETRDGGEYFNWSFAQAGFAEEAVFNSAREYAETLTDYQVKDEGNTDEGGGKSKDDGGKDF